MNKADRPGAERLVADLRHTLETRAMAHAATIPKTKTTTRHHSLISPTDNSDQTVPIILTEAVNNRNIDVLYKAILSHLERIRESGLFEEKRRHRLQKKILNILSNRFQSEFTNHLAAEADLNDAIDRIYSGQTNPYKVSAELYKRFIGK